MTGRPVQVDQNGLVRWEPAPPPLGPRTVADVLDQSLSRHPDRAALIDDAATLTYAELDSAANQSAHVLLAKGVRPGERVAACLPNRNDLVVLFLAVQRIGAIWVGINRALTATEQRSLIGQCGATVLFAEAETLDQLGDLAGDVDLVAFPDAGSWLQQHRDVPTARPGIEIDALAPAAIAYTSGTTGEPKGVVHSQHNLVLPGIVRLAEGSLRAGSRQGVVLPLTILNLMILGPVASFICGATCLPMRRIDSVGLAERVRRDRIESVALPPTSAYDLLHSTDVAPEDLTSLTDLGVGGMGTPPGLNERYRERFGRLFHSSYGLTEAPTAVTFDDRPLRPASSSGLPCAHLTVSIRDEDGATLAPGMVGDIWVGPRRDGPFAAVYSPMLGYWNRPEQTRAALRRDGWLRTGDRGALQPDGSLVVSGRRDDVILRGGANVYPAEVEAALAGHPDVAEAVVVGRPDERLGEAVVAVIRWRAGATATLDDLHALCVENLARYKRPAQILVMDEMPRNAMGKVVRSELKRTVGDR